MKTQKLAPALKHYIWGGKKLKKNFGIKTTENSVAEAWLLSTNKDGKTTLMDGTALDSILTKSDLGKNCMRFLHFPLLVKLIDAKQNLSVQVHPNDDFALKHENSFGKTEMWYVLDCEKSAGLYIGFKKEISKQEFLTAINDGSVLDLMNFFEVKKGQSYFIPAGTVHAIGAGCVICEVQQNSNVTYRVFDFNRTDDKGNKRPLHVEKALEVSTFSKYKNLCNTPKDTTEPQTIATCKYFSVTKKNSPCIVGKTDSFSCIVIIEGQGSIDGQNTCQGDCWFVPANHTASVLGNLKLLEIFV